MHHNQRRYKLMGRQLSKGLESDGRCRISWAWPREVKVGVLEHRTWTLCVKAASAPPKQMPSGNW